MSIIRVGLAETKNFAEGYDAIFGKKKDKGETKTEETVATDASKEAPPEEKK